MLRREFMAGLGIFAVLGPRKINAAVRDPLPAEGVELVYKVLYGENEIGTQKVKIREHDEAGHVVIEHEMAVEVRIFFARAYALEHRSTEIWEGFKLKSLRSETVENDERYFVEGSLSDAGFRVKNFDKTWHVPEDAVSSDSFWLAAALDAPRVINTRTGDTASPIVNQLDAERWHIKADFDHGPIEATVRFDGDFLAEAVIDSDGHTVTLQRI